MKVLFFSPFANIWDHSFPEALIAEGLVKQGADVLYVRCDGMLNAHCVAMAATGVDYRDSAATRAQVCRACIKRRMLIDNTMQFPSTVMDPLVTPADRDEAERICASVNRETWPNTMVNGVPLARYAAYEFILDHKLVGTHIPAALWDLYLDQLRNTILVFRIAQRIIAAESPTHLVVFNRLYSANHAFAAAAESVGIPTFTLQGGGHITRRAETMTMYRGSLSLADVFDAAAWQTYSRTPIGADEVALVGEHFSGLLEGSSAFAYSSAFEASDPVALRERFGIPLDSRVLLAPLSSEDEINAARLADALPHSNGQVSLFDGQFAWIAYLLEYAATHPRLHMIIRLHPRLFPNKRDNVQSPIVDELMALLASPPTNVTLNLPTDDVSLYDIMQIVDVLLSFRSAVGAEVAAFGTPVVVPANSDFFTYPDEINLIGRTIDEYSAMIDRALDDGWSIENSRRAFRWYAFLFSRVAVDFSDSVHARPIGIRPRKPGFRLWLWRKLVYLFIQFGPLVRERIALRNRRFPASSRELFMDVLGHQRGNLADSALWHKVKSSPRAETALLEDYLGSLANGLWKSIVVDDSLAGRIRAGVSSNG